MQRHGYDLSNAAATSEPLAQVVLIDPAKYTTVVRCSLDDNGARRIATILRSRVIPQDVVIWYGSDVYEGLDGGYRFDGIALRDPDGDTIAFSAEPER